MKVKIACLCVVIAGLVTSARILADKNATPTDHISTLASPEFVARFLASESPELTSYRARRTLTASTRGGRMTASLEAWTSTDANGRFQYEITNQKGSEIITRHVLIAALEAERRVHDMKDTSGDLTPANYEFNVDDNQGSDLLRVRLQPRRPSPMLVDGAVFVTHDALDIVRIEGQLSKRPSFWTRRVDITRQYARIGGVRVPIEMHSRADVRIVGESTFSMTYDYVTINGQSVEN